MRSGNAKVHQQPAHGQRHKAVFRRESGIPVSLVRMSKISSVEYSNPHARIRREHEDTIAGARAAYEKEHVNVEADFEEIERDWKKLLNGWRKKRISEQDFVEKAKLLEARVKANDSKRAVAMEHQNAVIEAQGKLNDSLRQERDDQFNKMRGLTSYMLGSGKGNAAVAYLHSVLNDFRNSSDRAEKDGIAASISSIFASAPELQSSDQVPSVLDDYNRIEDGEAKTSFYKTHRSEIAAAFNQQQGRNIDENNA